MNREVVVLPEASADVATAIAWYNRKVPGLGQAFLAEVNRQIRRICWFPDSYPHLGATTRRSNLHRFPYAIAYRNLPSVIEVIAVFDCRIDPITYPD